VRIAPRKIRGKKDKRAAIVIATPFISSAPQGGSNPCYRRESMYSMNHPSPNELAPSHA
jgi:hypothetical protein